MTIYGKYGAELVPAAELDYLARLAGPKMGVTACVTLQLLSLARLLSNAIARGP
jgi:hypothetical protein